MNCARSRNKIISKSIFIHSLERIVFVILMTAMLVGCGKGSGGGGGGVISGNNSSVNGVESITYTGLTSQALITESNVAYIAVRALQGGFSGTEASELGVSSAGVQSKALRPRALSLSQTLEKSLRSINLNSSDMSASAIQSDSGTEYGDCGGRVDYTINVNDVTGAFNGKETYYSYCSQGTTLSGNTSISGTLALYSGEVLDVHISFNPLYTTYNNDTSIMQGTIDFNFKAYPVTALMNLLLKCSCNEKIYKYENFSMTIEEGAGYMEFQMSGRFYEPDYGYVELSHEMPFRINDGKVWPSQGGFIIMGASGTNARFMIFSSNEYAVEADTDGDGNYDCSRIVKWDEDPGAGHPDHSSPTVPEGLTLSEVSDSRISLSWNASSDDIGVEGYKVYRDGTYLKSVTETFTYDEGIDVYSRYCYTVTAYDTAGNESAQSSIVCKEAKTEVIPANNFKGLSFTVIDAEYNKQIDKIIMVSSAPSSQLHIYDPVADSDTSIDLNLTPSSVSVSPDGLYAAVGHDGWVSYINLSTAELIKVIPVTTDVIDIVLAGNGYIYAFPRTDQWERIRCININTGLETLHSGGFILGGTLAKLHPGGSAIYTAENNSSPSDIEKYSIANGTAEMLYDSPYHGDFPVCGNVWISEDGLRIFTRCGNVFRASEVQAEDMTYNGSLSGLARIEHLTHSSSAEKIIAIPMATYRNSTADTKVQIYDYAFLSREHTIELPHFVVGPNAYSGHGNFVFFSSDGSEFYVVLKADGSSGMLYSYGVATYSIQDLPPIDVPPIDNPYGINFTVIDAEYSKQLDKIIMVSSAPSSQLHIYDPVTEHDNSVDLNLVTTSVSVSPDGLYAAVGHDGWVSYINLSTAELIKVIPVTTDVIDVVLAGNGYIYAFPRTDQWERIRCININTGLETLHSGDSIYAGTLAQLHPNGTAIYGADNGLSPSDIEKYSISNGTAEVLYDSPYHGDFPMCGNLWISEEGLRIFTRCGNVFRASEVQAEDMTYNGSLSGLSSVTHLSHSTAAGKVIAIPMNPYGTNDADTEILIYDYAFLTHEGTVALPSYVIGENSYSSHGQFVFINSDGSKYFVILKADDSSGIIYNYDIVSYSIQRG